METKVEKMESEADAFTQLAGDDTSLDDEFKQLGSSTDVDTKLLELKAKMGMLPEAGTTEKS